MQSASKLSSRLGLTFHRTFSLNRPAIAEVLRVAGSETGQVDAATLRDQTSLGSIYVEAMPRYARGCGLLELGNFALTPFGQMISAHDPDLNRPETQWLMHYHLSAPHGPGPAFWHHLVADVLRLGDRLVPGAVAADIARMHDEEDGLMPGERALRSTATIFLGSYSKPEGLNALGLLQKVKGGYQVQAPPPPPPAAVAAALADYWAGPLAGRLTVDLNELTRPGGFLSLFFLSSEQSEAILQALQRARLVEVHRLAPPFQVARLWHDPAAVLAGLYEDGSGG